MDQTLKPVLLTRTQAQLLDVEPGVPGIVSEIVAYGRNGEPVEYSWSVTSGDKCEFYFRFRHGSLT
jgi:DNA-binding GntR family transcriptional regulator